MGALIDADVSPENLLGVHPSFLSMSRGEHAWSGWMFYWYTARAPIISFAGVVCVCVGGTAQGHAASKTRNMTEADRELKLLAPRHSPIAHHLAPRFCVCLLTLPSMASPVWACTPKCCCPLASSDPQTLELEIVLVLDGP